MSNRDDEMKRLDEKIRNEQSIRDHASSDKIRQESQTRLDGLKTERSGFSGHKGK